MLKKDEKNNNILSKSQFHSPKEHQFSGNFMSIHIRCMDKDHKDVVLPVIRREDSIHPVEWYSHNNTDEPQVHCVKWKKPDPKGYLLFDSIYGILEKVELWKTDPWFSGMEGRVCGMELFYIIAVEIWVFVLMQTLPTVYNKEWLLLCTVLANRWGEGTPSRNTAIRNEPNYITNN